MADKRDAYTQPADERDEKISVVMPFRIVPVQTVCFGLRRCEIANHYNASVEGYLTLKTINMRSLIYWPIAQDLCTGRLFFEKDVVDKSIRLLMS